MSDRNHSGRNCYRCGGRDSGRGSGRGRERGGFAENRNNFQKKGNNKKEETNRNELSFFFKEPKHKNRLTEYFKVQPGQCKQVFI